MILCAPKTLQRPSKLLERQMKVWLVWLVFFQFALLTNTACRNPQAIVHSTCFVNLPLVMSTHLKNFRACIAGGLSCLQPGRRVILHVAAARDLAHNCVNQIVKASQPDYVFGRFELFPGGGIRILIRLAILGSLGCLAFPLAFS